MHTTNAQPQELPPDETPAELARMYAAQGEDAAAELTEHDPHTCLCNNLPSPCSDCREIFARQRAAKATAPLERFTMMSVRRSLAAAAGIQPPPKEQPS